MRFGARFGDPASKVIAPDAQGLAPSAGGIQLHPNYHAYDLAGGEAAALLQRAQDAGLPVRVATGLEDPRTQHWLVQVPPVGSATLASAITAFPALRTSTDRSPTHPATTRSSAAARFVSSGSAAVPFHDRSTEYPIGRGDRCCR